MSNNRYNLRSSAQQQVAPKFFTPSISTTGNTSTGAGTTSTTTSIGFTPESLLLSAAAAAATTASQSNLSQAGAGSQYQTTQPLISAEQQVNRQHSLTQTTQMQPQSQGNPIAAMDPFYQHHQQQHQNQNQYQHQYQYQQEQMTLGGPAATAPFLQDFTLVAEAVKRVQMDAVMTEMESITL